MLPDSLIRLNWLCKWDNGGGGAFVRLPAPRDAYGEFQTQRRQADGLIRLGLTEQVGELEPLLRDVLDLLLTCFPRG